MKSEPDAPTPGVPRILDPDQRAPMWWPQATNEPWNPQLPQLGDPIANATIVHEPAHDIETEGPTVAQVARPNSERPQGRSPDRPIAWEYRFAPPRPEPFTTLDQAAYAQPWRRTPLLFDVPGSGADRQTATSPVQSLHRIYSPEPAPWDVGQLTGAPGGS